MPQLNLPRRLVSTVQLWASLLLIVLAFVFSMTPIITFEFDGLDNFLEASGLEGEYPELDEFFDDLEDLDGFEVSSPKIIGSISILAEFLTALIEEDEDAFEDFLDHLDSEEGHEALATAFSFAIPIFNNIDGMEDGDTATIINTIITMFALIAVFFISLFFPVIFGFSALGAIIKSLKNIRTPEVGAPALAKKLPAKITLALLLMLLQCVVPGMSYASGLVAICVLSITSTVLNLLATRCREYPSEQFKYLNIVQGCAVINIVGFLLFFFNIINTGIFNSFMGEFIPYFAEVLMLRDPSDANMAFIIDGVLIIFYLSIVLGSRHHLRKSTARLTCSAKHERRKGFIGLFMPAKLRDSDIVSSVLCLIAYIIPTYIMGVKHGYRDITSNKAEGNFSFLDLNKDGEAALSAALVGIILMIVADVAVIVLKKVFCSKLTKEDADAVLAGSAKTSDERLAEAQRIIAESEGN